MKYVGVFLLLFLSNVSASELIQLTPVPREDQSRDHLVELHRLYSCLEFDELCSQLDLDQDLAQESVNDICRGDDVYHDHNYALKPVFNSQGKVRSFLCTRISYPRPIPTPIPIATPMQDLEY